MSTENDLPQAISFQDFERVDIRVGRIVRAEEFPRARKPAFKLWIDFGPLGIKQSSAQITVHYDVQSLAGKLVVAGVNFPVKQIADFRSEVLVLGSADTDGAIVLLGFEKEVPEGSRIF